MPVRIYDISKKLGLENKEVLAKAKELGIAAAKVASSSLDKITAEYLEQQLILAHPERTVVVPPPPIPVPPAATPQATPANEPITLLSSPAPRAEVRTAQESGAITATSTGLHEPPAVP